jgi:hypothetical protein
LGRGDDKELQTIAKYVRTTRIFYHTPILTSNGCEGAGEAFRIALVRISSEDGEAKSESVFFSNPHTSLYHRNRTWRYSPPQSRDTWPNSGCLKPSVGEPVGGLCVDRHALPRRCRVTVKGRRRERRGSPTGLYEGGNARLGSNLYRREYVSGGWQVHTRATVTIIDLNLFLPGVPPVRA